MSRLPSALATAALLLPAALLGYLAGRVRASAARDREIEAFVHGVRHDLRGPLGAIDGFTQALELDYGQTFDEHAREYLGWIKQASLRMREVTETLELRRPSP